jgi:hypothetical protein
MNRNWKRTLNCQNRGWHWGVFNTVIPQAYFVNYRSFWVQNCKYCVPQDFQYQDFQYLNFSRKIPKYRKKNKLIPPYRKSQCPPQNNVCHKNYNDRRQTLQLFGATRSSHFINMYWTKRISLIFVTWALFKEYNY